MAAIETPVPNLYRMGLSKMSRPREMPQRWASKADVQDMNILTAAEIYAAMEIDPADDGRLWFDLLELEAVVPAPGIAVIAYDFNTRCWALDRDVIDALIG